MDVTALATSGRALDEKNACAHGNPVCRGCSGQLRTRRCAAELVIGSARLKIMNRILILDVDQPLRDELTDALRRTAQTEVAVAADAEELVSKVKYGAYAAVFVDRDRLDGDASRLIAAVKSSVTRPMLVVAANEKAEDLDPDFVTLVVRKPYDVLTLTGVLLSAVIKIPSGPLGEGDSRVAK
jgi:CheY-like chemotaxis protein